MIPFHLTLATSNSVQVDAELAVVRESASTISLDGQSGFALALAPLAMKACIAKAAETGICLTTVRASNPFRIAGAYARMAAERGLGGIAMMNASPLVVPTFGRAAKLGTNLIAFAAPRSDSAIIPRP